MIYNIDTKFEIGDLFYVVRYRYDYDLITCSFCGGDKNVVGKNNEALPCPSCLGRGAASVERGSYDVIQDVYQVTGFHVSILSDIDIEVLDYRECVEESFNLDSCFSTKEEAQKEADKRNGV